MNTTKNKEQFGGGTSRHQIAGTERTDGQAEQCIVARIIAYLLIDEIIPG
jgi:hypothetical protein